MSSYKCMHHTQSFFHYLCTDVLAPTIMTVTGKNSIFLEWSPPSEGSPLSYTVTWTGRGVTSSDVLPPTAHNYTIRGLDSNTAYLGTVEVYSLANNVTVSWGAHTLPQGERVCISALCMICSCSNTTCIKTCIIAYFLYCIHLRLSLMFSMTFHVFLIACIELHNSQRTGAYTRSEANHHVTSLIAHAQ